MDGGVIMGGGVIAVVVVLTLDIFSHRPNTPGISFSNHHLPLNYRLEFLRVRNHDPHTHILSLPLLFSVLRDASHLPKPLKINPAKNESHTEKIDF